MRSGGDLNTDPTTPLPGHVGPAVLQVHNVYSTGHFMEDHGVSRTADNLSELKLEARSLSHNGGEVHNADGHADSVKCRSDQSL